MRKIRFVANMSKCGQIALPVLLVLLLSGCAALHPDRESAFSVRGTILTNDAHPPVSCVLEVYRKKGNRLVKQLEVPRRFERTVVIAPGVHEYYMAVSCPGSSTKVSATYKLGSVYYLSHPVDLGEINLKAASVGTTQQ